MSDEPVVKLERWDGPWEPDDPDAGFKTDIALYSLADPLHTIRNMSAHINVPVGALCRYVLAKWATGGGEGVLELGPSTVTRMWDACVRAEEEDTDAARLAAYEQLRQILSWLRIPLEDED